MSTILDALRRVQSESNPRDLRESVLNEGPPPPRRRGPRKLLLLVLLLAVGATAWFVWPGSETLMANGNRLSTYAITGDAGGGQICITGAAARLVDPDDRVIICCYGQFHQDQLADHTVRVVHVDDNNRITETVMMDAVNSGAATGQA